MYDMVDTYKNNNKEFRPSFAILSITAIPNHKIILILYIGVMFMWCIFQWAKAPKKQSVGVYFWQHGIIFWVPN